jgi:hypothetical protein
MKKALLSLFILMTFSLFSQNCNCHSNLDWLIETFEKNDAGFQYIIDEKGEIAYQAHNKLFRKKSLNTDNLSDCHKLLNEWTAFFRKFHLSVELLKQEKKTEKKTEKKLSDNEIIEKYSNSERFEIKKGKFDKYIENLKEKTSFEGVWVSEPYTIGIIKDKSNPEREYVGFIINSDSPYWQKNQVKLEIFKSDTEDKYSVNYYMRDHSVKHFDNVQFIGENYLKLEFVLLKRTLPENEPNPEIELHFKSIVAYKPFLEKIDENTVFIRIPSFGQESKSLIDSLLIVNQNLITSHKNLVIDLRNNGGGSDASYEKLIPFLYTNPIRIVGVEYLSTPLNNKRMTFIMNDTNFPDDTRKWAKKSLEKLNKNIGKFINLNDDIVSIDTLDTIYSYPKNVALLINQNCGSTTEQFLLEAKQSKKVKLFGITTSGGLDISNIYFVNSPCDEFKLWYGLTKSYRVPEMTIDNKGIQPDFYLDKTISKYEWIDYTLKILNE